jgi:GTP cyclohydrolase II
VTCSGLLIAVRNISHQIVPVPLPNVIVIIPYHLSLPPSRPTMPDYPAHASPAFPPVQPPRPKRAISDFRLESNPANPSVAPPPLVSPALTPPETPFAQDDQRPDRQPRGVNVADYVEDDAEEKPQLLPKLPHVECAVRARIPTTAGQEMWLNLYHNDADEKEHLAIVFGPHIRSRSLDAVRPGETERDRMIRGAYTGTLYPGRTSSRLDAIRKDAGVTKRPSSGYLSALNGPTGKKEEADSDTSSIISGYPDDLGPAMVRIHSECYTGETVWSARCDCGEQLDEAARLMSLPIPTPASTPGSEVGETDSHKCTTKLPSAGGVIIYLRQEGRGIGLMEKLKAYNLQDLGHDTMEANLLLRHPGDARSYGLATAMLMDLGLDGERGIKLLTNNPDKVRAVEGPNREVRVVERVPMVPIAWQTHGKSGVQGPEVEKYLSTKIEKFKHMLTGGA